MGEREGERKIIHAEGKVKVNSYVNFLILGPFLKFTTTVPLALANVSMMATNRHLCAVGRPARISRLYFGASGLHRPCLTQGLSSKLGGMWTALGWAAQLHSFPYWALGSRADTPRLNGPSRTRRSLTWRMETRRLQTINTPPQ